MPMNPDGEMLFKRNYTSQGDGSVEFTGEAQPVVKQVDYVNANQNKEVATMAQTEKKGGCCPEKVELLIQDAATKWGEDDREMLLTMSAEQLEKLTPVEVPAKETPAAPPVMNEEQAAKVLQGHFGDPKKFMALLPPEIRASVEHGMKLHDAHRSGIIAKIMASSPDVYTAEELAGMSIDVLDKLARIAKVPMDNTLLGGTPPQPAAYSDEGLFPPGVEA
jgi:hypothetical protein